MCSDFQEALERCPQLPTKDEKVVEQKEPFAPWRPDGQNTKWIKLFLYYQQCLKKSHR